MKLRYLFAKYTGFLVLAFLLPFQNFAQCWSGIDAGELHTMAIRSDGSLWGWGFAGYYNLGDGTAVLRTLPYRIGTQTNWSKVSCGFSHTLALKTDGTLWGWGQNFNGEVGNQIATNILPVQIGNGTNYIHVSAGYQYTVALRANGTIWSCGYNNYGQLGSGTTNGRSAIAQIGTATNWTGIEAGYNHTVGIRADGTIWAWGYNGAGQLGDGTLTNRTTPTQIGTATDWVAISAGYNHTLALKSDGTLWAWGQNIYGELGDNTTTYRTSPVQIGNDTNWQKIYTGYQHSVAIKTNGTLWAWGRNNYGQVGDGTTINRLVPTQIGTDSDWDKVAAGAYQTQALKITGERAAWGYNRFGELGNPVYSDVIVPTQTVNGNNWVKTSGGGVHTLALKSDGTLWSCGENYNGVLGNGTNVNSAVFTLVGTDHDWSVFWANDQSNLAIKTNGTLWGWGNRTWSQMGPVISPVYALSPFQIGTDSNWAKVSGDDAHTIAIKTNGTLWSWGTNYNNSLGNGGSPFAQPTPTQLGTATNWIEVAGGESASMALKSDGTIWTWGWNYIGQNGTGSSFGDAAVPTQMGTDTDWTAISFRGRFCIALKNNGTLWTWGDGQSGTNPTTQYTPRQISTDTDWVSIAAGTYTAFAIKSDGSLWVWGSNERHQCGDGILNLDYSSSSASLSHLTPAQVGSDHDWAKVAAGTTHVTAIKTDGSFWAWGYKNYGGQLGDGNTDHSTVPVQMECTALGLDPIEPLTATRLYPNPTNELIDIISQNTIDNIDVYDLQGRLVLSQQAGTTHPVISLAALTNATYILKLQSDKAVETFKVVKN